MEGEKNVTIYASHHYESYQMKPLSHSGRTNRFLKNPVATNMEADSLVSET